MSSTKLRKVSLFAKLFVLMSAGITFFIGFVFPPIWLLTFLMIGSCIGYRAEGHCPICGEYIEVSKKRGGVQCKGCRSSLIVRNKQLWTIH